MMTLFPVLMYYLWICLRFYDGAIARPTALSPEAFLEFGARMWGHVRDVSLTLS